MCLVNSVTLTADVLVLVVLDPCAKLWTRFGVNVDDFDQSVPVVTAVVVSPHLLHSHIPNHLMMVVTLTTFMRPIIKGNPSATFLVNLHF